MKTEANFLADAFESTRQLSKWYLSKLKDVDMRLQFTSNGITLNSAYWLVGHLVWAENFLLLKCLGGKPIEAPWLEEFALGSKLTDDEKRLPEVKEILDKWKEVHAAAMQHVRSLPDEILSQDNPLGMGFGGDNSYRMILHHAIRHEGIHAGQLSWLCKLHHVQTI